MFAARSIAPRVGNRTTNFFQRRWNTDLRNKIQKKSPMQLVNEVPPIEVDKPVVACSGDQRVAHPTEYIRVTPYQPSRCKYCSLRFIRKKKH